MKLIKATDVKVGDKVNFAIEGAKPIIGICERIEEQGPLFRTEDGSCWLEYFPESKTLELIEEGDSI